MRKLPIGPLVVLLVIFLVSHFASAAVGSPAESKPTQLPAKLPPKAASKIASVRKTVATKTSAVKKKIAATAPARKTLPKSLPAFKGQKRVQLNFEEIPSTPLEQSVVVLSPALEAPQDPNAIAAESIADLAQDLPIKPPQAPPVPEQAFVERPFIQILPEEPTGELWQSNPAAVAAVPLREEVASPVIAAAEETVSATTTSAAVETTAEATSTASATATSTASTTSTSTSTSTSTLTSTSTASPSLATLSQQPTEIAPAISTETAPAIVARIESPREQLPSTQVFVRTGYLAANYSALSAELRDGAPLFGLSLGRDLGPIDLKASLDFAYGRENTVSVDETRMMLLRAEALYLFPNFGIVRPLIGAGIGFATIDVRSYRQIEGTNDYIVREHAEGSTITLSPQAGVRVVLARSILVDATAQYLTLLGGENVSKLGGALVELSLGFAF